MFLKTVQFGGKITIFKNNFLFLHKCFPEQRFLQKHDLLKISGRVKLL